MHGQTQTYSTGATALTSLTHLPSIQYRKSQKKKWIETNNTERKTHTEGRERQKCNP